MVINRPPVPPPLNEIKQEPDVEEKELTLADFLSIAKKQFKVVIPNLGVVYVRLPTIRDQFMALTQSKDGDDHLEYKKMIVHLCLVRPKTKSETELDNFPDSTVNAILRGINKISKQFNEVEETPDFLE